MTKKKEPPSERTLDRDIPELKEYLKPGMKVLDVGCGTGTITLGVADAVKPGEVVGVDPKGKSVSAARGWMAESSDLDNCSFIAGDSHALDFPDDTFDLVYSHRVLLWLLDPVAALREQRRVTKPGGWVIGAGVVERLASPRYPECPNWYRVSEAMDQYHQALQADHRTSGDSPVDYIKKHLEINSKAMISYDMRAGRKCPEWFQKSGLAVVQIRVKGENVQYHGSEIMGPGYRDLVLIDKPKRPIENQMILWLDGTVRQGLLDKQTVEKAKEEIRAWYQNPIAFHYRTEVFAAGRA